MSYTIVISQSVQKQIDDLPNDVLERVVEKIQNLADDPRPDGVVNLKNSDNEYRVRIGDYRVRYEINDESQLVQLLQGCIPVMQIGFLWNRRLACLIRNGQDARTTRK